MTIHARVVAARQRLRDAGIPADEAELDARLLAEHLLGWTTERYFVDSENEEPRGFDGEYEALIARRAGREPFAYIVGRQEFWGQPFEVSPAVLIPRPETELLVEIALELLSERSAASVCDIGTGTGCVAVSIARERRPAAITATDVSADALAVARRNARRLDVADRIAFVETDLFAGLTGAFDLVVSNPPYVAERDRTTIQPEVGRFEPERALFAGADGLDVIRRLVRDAPSHLAPGGCLAFEFGFGQADDVTDIVSRAQGLVIAGVRRDLQGIPRVAVARKVNE